MMTIICLKKTSKHVVLLLAKQQKNHVTIYLFTMELHVL